MTELRYIANSDVSAGHDENPTWRFTTSLFLFGVMAGSSFVGTLEAARFSGIGHLPEDTSSSTLGISADGSVVVGASGLPSVPGGSVGFSARPIAWTSAGGLVALSETEVQVNGANAASGDGSFIGGIRTGKPDEVFPFCGTAGTVWTVFNGFQDARTLMGDPAPCDINEISDNGNVFIGRSGEIGIFKWSFTAGYEDLSPPPLTTATLTGVSADGSIVVGNASSGNSTESYRWTPSGRFPIGGFSEAFPHKHANDISSDGTTIVGVRNGQSGSEAFHWTQADGIQVLPELPGTLLSTSARAVSSDGSVIVGRSSDKAFVWSESLGTRDIKNVLESEYGLNLGDWQLTSATAVSNDGLVITGHGVNPQGEREAWVASLRVFDEMRYPQVTYTVRHFPTAGSFVVPDAILGDSMESIVSANFESRGFAEFRIPETEIPYESATLVLNIFETDPNAQHSIWAYEGTGLRNVAAWDDGDTHVADLDLQGEEEIRIDVTELANDFRYRDLDLVLGFEIRSDSQLGTNFGGVGTNSPPPYIELVESPFPGDFDDDRDVDGADFLKWQRDDGTLAGLALWGNNYGTSSSSASAAVESIPEPSSSALVFLCLCVSYRCRRPSRV